MFNCILWSFKLYAVEHYSLVYDFYFRSSDQTDLAAVKVKSKVIVELPLSVSG